MSSRTCRAALAAVLAALGMLTLAVPVSAQRPHPPFPVPEQIDLPALVGGVGFCPGFDARITFTNVNQFIISETTDPVTGITTLRVTGRARATVTNLTTGESVSFNISGPGTLVLNPDGSFSANLAGPNLLFTDRQNLANFPSVPTISYTTGRVTFAVDRFGQTTAYSLAGGSRQTDVCALLAS